MKRTVEVKVVSHFRIPVEGQDADSIFKKVEKMFETGALDNLPCITKIDKMKMRK